MHIQFTFLHTHIDKYHKAALYLINRHSRRGRAAHEDNAVEEGKHSRSGERRQTGMKQRATQRDKNPFDALRD